MALTVGSRLGHYDVTALIGEGGMGQVYQATDTKLNRQVALKIKMTVTPLPIARTLIAAWLLLGCPVYTSPLAAQPPASVSQTAGADHGRVVEVEIPAPSLAGNLMGTATTQSATVYLPRGYDDVDRRYPTVYLLRGIFDTAAVWTNFYNLPAMLDGLISAGRIPETVVVLPTAANELGGGYYRDSPVSGNWASYIATDLIGFVDGTFRTRASPESRAVIGHSMGGYGALHLTMTRPGIFAVAWAMSPCCLEPVDDLGFGNAAWRRTFGFDEQSDLVAALEANDFYAVATLGALTAFSPDPDNPPFYVSFPFDLVRGELVVKEGAYDSYLDRFPVRHVAAAREALRGLRGLALDAGIGDQFRHIPANTLEFSRRLGEQRIPHLLDIYDGDHRQQVSRRLEELILPWVLERLDH